MKLRKIASLLGLLVFATSVLCAQPLRKEIDILGKPFTAQTIDQPADYEGAVVTTLVRYDDPSNHSKIGMLYVHGYNDYFFQHEFADRMNDAGIRFYAMDLRKYGRSHRLHQRHFEVHELSEYFADLDTTIALIRREGIERLYIVGHSTGGLITSLYMNHRPALNGYVGGLILNSPFLDMNASWFVEKVAIPFIAWIAPFFPKLKVNDGNSDAYARSLLKEYSGEWGYITDWKFTISPPKTATWMRSIYRGQGEVRRGLHIGVPVMLLHSDKSFSAKKFDERMLAADCVLDVNDMKRLAPNLGPDVRRVEIRNGLHDLALSRLDVRNEYFAQVLAFIRGDNTKK